MVKAGGENVREQRISESKMVRFDELRYTGTRRQVSERKSLRSSIFWNKPFHMNKTHFVICIENSEYPASLEKRKIYETIPDADAARHGQIRVIDESGQDYLYPKECFADANLPGDIRAAVVEAA